MALISLDRSSRLLAQLREVRRFGINILSAEQADAAVRFASKDIDKFTGVGWYLQDGLPRLHGTAGWLTCEAVQFVPGGDHVIVFGVVTDAVPADVPPLTYRSRGFGTHLPLQTGSRPHPRSSAPASRR